MIYKFWTSKYAHYITVKFLIGNVRNGLWRPYAPQHSATTCLEIRKNEQRITFMCQTFYVEGVVPTP